MDMDNIGPIPPPVQLPNKPPPNNTPHHTIHRLEMKLGKKEQNLPKIFPAAFSLSKPQSSLLENPFPGIRCGIENCNFQAVLD